MENFNLTLASSRFDEKLFSYKIHLNAVKMLQRNKKYLKQNFNVAVLSTSSASSKSIFYLQSYEFLECRDLWPDKMDINALSCISDFVASLEDTKMRM